MSVILNAPAEGRAAALEELRRAEVVEQLALEHDWSFWGRWDQREPPAPWRTWLLLGGRGSGKTRAGAEWVRGEVRGRRLGRLALIGSALADVREVMIDGPSGLLSLGPRGERPAFQPSRRRLEWPNGAVAYAFSAEDPESLRGPQFDGAWLDEFAAWRNPQLVFDLLQFGLRLGTWPRQTVTTTPRRSDALRRLLDTPGTVTTRATTMANGAFLAPGFVAAMQAAYGQSLLGRQELLGEMVEDDGGGLWSRELIARAMGTRPEQLDEIVVGVDPPATEGPAAAGCGVIVVGVEGRGDARRAWVLGDRSIQGATPEAWARRVVETVRSFDANRVVAEVNQGGAMVRTVLRFVDPALRITEVRATKGKQARAEPVLLLYEMGSVRHAGAFPQLEDELCVFGAGWGGQRCDRVDALVWAVTALMDTNAPIPRMRTL